MVNVLLLVIVVLLLALVFGAGIIYQLISVTIGIIVLLILIGIAFYIWRRI